MEQILSKLYIKMNQISMIISLKLNSCLVEIPFSFLEIGLVVMYAVYNQSCSDACIYNLMCAFTAICDINGRE